MAAVTGSGGATTRGYFPGAAREIAFQKREATYRERRWGEFLFWSVAVSSSSSSAFEGMAAARNARAGRRRISLQKISNGDARMVSFSKRRSGLFKKAAELAILCGAEIAAVVFSPSGKPFSFGHPSVEAVANPLLGENADGGATGSQQEAPAAGDFATSGLQLSHEEVCGNFEAQVRKRETVEAALTGVWARRNVNVAALRLEQLSRVKSSMEALRREITRRAEELRVSEFSLAPMSPAPPPAPSAPRPPAGVPLLLTLDI